MAHRFLVLAVSAVCLAPACFPAELAAITLPSPSKAGSTSVEAALAARRSVRSYTKQAVTLADVGQLLWTAQGITSTDGMYERMGSGVKNRTWTDYEAGLASENLLLEAVALGLGAVITGGIDPASVKEAVKLTGGEEVIVVIPLGHPTRGKGQGDEYQ